MVSDSLTPSDGGRSSSAPIVYSDMFFEHLPYFLSIGMTWDEYWNEDCTRAKYYKKADDLRKQRKNQELWLQGLYVYEAIADMSPVLTSTFSKKPRKPLEYSPEPYPLTAAEKADKEEREAKKKLAILKDKMVSRSMKLNQKIDKGVTNDGRGNNG